MSDAFRYSLRAAIESTISELVNGHGMRQCRYRSQKKAHVQHVLTAIAVNLERIDVHLPPAPARQPRTPTALPRSPTASGTDHALNKRPRRPVNVGGAPCRWWMSRRPRLSLT
ncbi:transposase [Streptomyces sp. NPDC088400]|uniref:transposase n=1 Tax=Streptomyces sp. NPDC088400 TaxID=3365861 RepID=UPI00380B883F